MPSTATEYLVSFGASGDFGRFASSEPLACRRGDPLVIETTRGVEMGKVMRAAEAGHARLLGGGAAGRILRQPTPEDLETRDRRLQQSKKLFDAARRRAAELDLCLEVVDAEILLEGRQAVLHVLRWGDLDLKPLTDSVLASHGCYTLIQDLASPASPEDPEDEALAGCGSGGCGSGGCGSGGCGSGGCGTCSSHGCSSSSRPASEARPQAISLL
jgi:hypothetical protein